MNDFVTSLAWERPAVLVTLSFGELRGTKYDGEVCDFVFKYARKITTDNCICILFITPTTQMLWKYHL